MVGEFVHLLRTTWWRPSVRRKIDSVDHTRARPEVGGHATSSARGAFEPEADGRDGIAWIDNPFTGRSTLKPTTG
jgi:hypothetical protein